MKRRETLLTPRITPLHFQKGILKILDQRLLPLKEVWIQCRTPGEVAEAIRSMAIRGAPLLGIAAAYGMALLGKQARDPRRFEEALHVLRNSRPTAVNLRWALRRMEEVYSAQRISPRLPELLLAEARKIQREQEEADRSMAEAGARAISGSNLSILTHCNTGALATGGIGTALGVLRVLHKQKRLSRVFVCETRPYLQGSRLTAWELHQERIPFTIISEGAAAWVMARQNLAAVIVGADRIARNGDTANKIGTYGLALLAQEFRIPFLVVAPLSTFDTETPHGSSIPVEERNPEELRCMGKTRIIPKDFTAYNPAFDITPHHLITAYICERGVIRKPAEIYSEPAA